MKYFKLEKQILKSSWQNEHMGTVRKVQKNNKWAVTQLLYKCISTLNNLVLAHYIQTEQ